MTRVQLKNYIKGLLTDALNGQITPAVMRKVTSKIIDDLFNIQEDTIKVENVEGLAELLKNIAAYWGEIKYSATDETTVEQYVQNSLELYAKVSGLGLQYGGILELPQDVFLGWWYSVGGIGWAPTQDMYAVAAPSGGNWRKVLEAASGAAPLFEADITVSLSGGKSAGRFVNGQTVAARGKTANDILLDMLSEPVYPTYQPAQVTLSSPQALVGEAGESVSAALVATYRPGDAGPLVALSVRQDGTVLNQQGSSPLALTRPFVRPLGSMVFQAFADYAAGVAKPVAPANTPDPRPAQVRNPDAPQAAENNLPSQRLTFIGELALFFGPCAAPPTTSNQVRTLTGKQLASAPNSIILDTGNTLTCFAVWVPGGRALQLVTDLETNATLTSQYIPSSLAVADAGGTLRDGTLYVMRQAVAYSSSHRHLLTT